jgi:hypothetical protein
VQEKGDVHHTTGDPGAILDICASKCWCQTAESVPRASAHFCYRRHCAAWCRKTAPALWAKTQATCQQRFSSHCLTVGVTNSQPLTKQSGVLVCKIELLYCACNHVSWLDRGVRLSNTREWYYSITYHESFRAHTLDIICIQTQNFTEAGILNAFPLTTRSVIASQLTDYLLKETTPGRHFHTNPHQPGHLILVCVATVTVLTTQAHVNLVMECVGQVYMCTRT